MLTVTPPHAGWHHTILSLISSIFNLLISQITIKINVSTFTYYFFLEQRVFYFLHTSYCGYTLRSGYHSNLTKFPPFSSSPIFQRLNVIIKTNPCFIIKVNQFLFQTRMHNRVRCVYFPAFCHFISLHTSSETKDALEFNSTSPFFRVWIRVIRNWFIWFIYGLVSHFALLNKPKNKQTKTNKKKNHLLRCVKQSFRSKTYLYQVCEGIW